MPKWNMEESIKNKFKNYSTPELVRQIEGAPDFGYDDEEYELTRRLKLKGMSWRWNRKTPREKVEIVPIKN